MSAVVHKSSKARRLLLLASSRLCNSAKEAPFQTTASSEGIQPLVLRFSPAALLWPCAGVLAFYWVRFLPGAYQSLLGLYRYCIKYLYIVCLSDTFDTEWVPRVEGVRLEKVLGFKL